MSQQLIYLDEEEYYSYLIKKNAKAMPLSINQSHELRRGNMLYYIRKKSNSFKYQKGYYYIVEPIVFDETGKVIYKEINSLISNKFTVYNSKGSLYYSRVAVLLSNHMRRPLRQIPDEVFCSCGILCIDGKYISLNRGVHDSPFACFLADTLYMRKKINNDTIMDVFKIDKVILKKNE